MNHSATSTADVLGLDPRIGGHDRLVVLCLLAHAHVETGEAATAGELAGPSKIGSEELVAGALRGLLNAGYAEAEVVAIADDSGRAFAGTKPWAGSTHTGYRITKEGLNALGRHLSALEALPDSLRSHLLHKSSGKAALAEGAEAQEKGR